MKRSQVMPISPEDFEVARFLTKISQKKIKTVEDKVEVEEKESPESPEPSALVEEVNQVVEIPLSPINSAWGYTTVNCFKDSSKKIISCSEDSSGSDEDEFKLIGEERREEEDLNTPGSSHHHHHHRERSSSPYNLTEVYLPRSWKHKVSRKTLRKALQQLSEEFNRTGTYVEIGEMRARVCICKHNNIHLRPVEDEDFDYPDIQKVRFNYV